MSVTKTGEIQKMRKIVLSTLAALSIASVASAADVKLYSDENGQVFTKPAEGRTELTTTTVKTKSNQLDFSMLAYIGFKNTDYKGKNATAAGNVDKADFEARRMYFQVKAHLLDDPKSYFRVTYDVFPAIRSGSTTDQYYAGMVKYAYLYLNDILPFTGIEIGQAHTTLLDYEEGHSWAYRSIDNVFTEEANGPGLYASAGRGADIKTNTKWFSSEIGFYNGEGYHQDQVTSGNNGMGFDFEGRFTAHMLGTGTDYKTSHTYWDVSLLLKHNVNSTTGTTDTTKRADIDAVGLHTVFNTKPLLVSAQYWSLPDTLSGDDVSKKAGSGYSANFDARLGENSQYHVFGRYDNWKPKKPSGTVERAQRTYIGGAAWDMNKNVQWVANVIVKDNEAGTANSNNYMITAQVSF